jgi:hypothetical protein
MSCSWCLDSVTRLNLQEWKICIPTPDGSSVSSVTKLRVVRLRFDSRQRQIFLLATTSRPALGLTQWLLGSLSPEIKRLGRETDHLPSSSAGVKNARNYTSSPSYVFLAWCLVKETLILPYTSGTHVTYKCVPS